jgi:hypothetical protein
MGKTTARPLKDCPTLQNLRDALPLQRLTRLFLPGIGQKSATVKACNRRGDAQLQAQQVAFDRRSLRAHGVRVAHGFLVFSF